MSGLVVATYLWFDPASRHNDKYTYGPDDVRLLQRMVRRHLTVPHEFACITDRPELFADDPDIRAIPLDWSKHVPRSCFVRLMTFHPKGRELIGERVLQMDLDCVVVGNMDALVDRPEDLVLWRNPARVPWENPTVPARPYYNGSLLLHRCGTMPEMWTRFDARNPLGLREDQNWYHVRLGPHAPYWDGSHGVYRLARADTPGSGVEGVLPENARIVFFPGDCGKPWLPEVRARCPWIEEHRR